MNQIAHDFGLIFTGGPVLGFEPTPSQRRQLPAKILEISAHGSGGCLGGFDWRRMIGVNQFGPDAVPVIGADVASCDGAIRGALDVGAAFNGDGPDTVSPLTYGGRFHGQEISQRLLASGYFTGAIDWVHRARS